MTGIARMAVLDLRTVAPHRNQGLLMFALVVLLDIRSPSALVPALTLVVAAGITSFPFSVADKADLETLYAVLPVPRRSVLCGHYLWAVANFLVTAGVGTLLALLVARVQSLPLDGDAIALAVTLAGALFAISIGVQFPLLIRFGYSQISVMATTLPLIAVGIVVLRLNVTIASIQLWLPAIAVASVAVMAVSLMVAITVDPRRVRPGVAAS
jgi:hypothetical protein